MRLKKRCIIKPKKKQDVEAKGIRVFFRMLIFDNLKNAERMENKNESGQKQVIRRPTDKNSVG